MFFNRVQDLQWLRHRYESDAAEFIVLTGRRRVGKTALLNEFATAKNGVYYALFSRSGFTQPLLDRAKADPELLLFDPTMVISADA